MADDDRRVSIWRRPLVQTLAIFLGLWLIFGWVALQLPVLPDTDSYFHLEVARLYAEEGLVDQLPWLRFSLLQGVEGVGFGDKELLFHVLLAPFTSGESTVGARWALAFWNALAFTTLAAVSRVALGRWKLDRWSLGSWRLGGWSLLIPALIWLGSLDFLGRAVRLRPETPAMVLFVLAAVCAGSRRYRLLGLVMFAFTLTYTAFHALLGLCELWFLWQAWQARRAGSAIPWRGLAYPVLGCGAALLAHPHFPQNIVLWKTQSIDFFRFKNQLDVGTEIGAQATDKMLLQNLPWLLGCLVLLLAALRYRREERASEDPAVPSKGSADPNEAPTRDLSGIADALTIAAGCFGVLFLLMMRFSTHALPLLTLALVFRLAVSGRGPGRTLRLPGGLHMPTALALALVLAAGTWRSGTFVHNLATAGEREPEWQAFGRAVPADARVAAPWGQTPQYYFWAPKTAGFLNDLDPVFMAVPYPDVYRLQRSVFDGTEPDVPVAVAAGLDSDHLAMSRFLMPPSLAARLTADPRVQLVYDGWSLLFRIAPPPPEQQNSFLVDWRLVPQGGDLPVSPDVDIANWRAYPHLGDPDLRGLEAYVDGRRVDTPGRCFAVTRDLSDDLTHESAEGGSGKRRFELAAAGPTTLWSQTEWSQTEWSQTDGAPAKRIQILDSPGAVLGRGVLFDLEAAIDTDGTASAGRTRLTVVSCLAQSDDPKTPRQIGFYLRRR